jgi:hypothetical protein
MLLVSALLSNSLALAAKKPVDPAVMKARIQARGVGQGVRVTLADTTEVKGLIVAVGEHSFAVKAKKADQPREIEYTQITGVYRDKLTRGQDVAITVGVVAGAIVIISVVLLIKFDHAKF